MIKLRYVVALLIIAGFTSLPTFADTYDFTFTATSGAAPTDGYFTYNGSEFTAFNIDLPNTEVGIIALQWGLDLQGIGTEPPGCFCADAQYFADITSTATGYYWYAEGWDFNGRAAFVLDGPGDPNPTNEADIAQMTDVGGEDTNNSVGDEGVGTYTLTDISAVPEPDILSLLFSGLLVVGLLAGVKRYRENRLATDGVATAHCTH